jgi:YD repeat-containing protein
VVPYQKNPPQGLATGNVLLIVCRLKGQIDMKNFVKFTACAAIAMGLSLVATTADAQPKYAKPYYENVALRYDITEPKKLGLKYDVYAGGFHALDASLEMDLTKEAYDMQLQAETTGFIGSMFPWKGEYSSSGHSDAGVLIPTLSTSRSEWRSKVKTTELSYDPKGNLLKSTTQQGAKTTVERDVKKELAADAVDMLTGTLLMMQNAKNTEKCEGSFPVFDGKRRYNITMADDGMDNIGKSKYSKFSGKALRCTLKVEPVAGFKDKDKGRGWMAVQNHTEARKKPPTIWLARIEDKGPVVPVRMEIASDYGAVVAHLSGAAKN